MVFSVLRRIVIELDFCLISSSIETAQIIIISDSLTKMYLIR